MVDCDFYQKKERKKKTPQTPLLHFIDPFLTTVVLYYMICCKFNAPVGLSHMVYVKKQTTAI